MDQSTLPEGKECGIQLYQSPALTPPPTPGALAVAELAVSKLSSRERGSKPQGGMVIWNISGAGAFGFHEGAARLTAGEIHGF